MHPPVNASQNGTVMVSSPKLIWQFNTAPFFPITATNSTESNGKASEMEFSWVWGRCRLAVLADPFEDMPPKLMTAPLLGLDNTKVQFFERFDAGSEMGKMTSIHALTSVPYITAAIGDASAEVVVVSGAVVVVVED